MGPLALSQLPSGCGVVETGVEPSQLWVWLKCIVWQSEHRLFWPECHSPASTGIATSARTAAARAIVRFLMDGISLVIRSMLLDLL